MEASTWYKDAVFYELYVRAFKDGNNDGNGDFKGLLSQLDYLQELGVDCVWLLPMYPSPLVDDGYDVADYRGIHPDFGTMEDFKAVIDGVHERGMKIIVDIVLNHTSDQHPWFIRFAVLKKFAKARLVCVERYRHALPRCAYHFPGYGDLKLDI